MNDHEMNEIALMLICYSAGSDTVRLQRVPVNFVRHSQRGAKTVSAILSFLLIIAQHPAIHQRAQDEVDAIVRMQGRPPKCCDRQRMPYLDAVLKEVHRCNTVVPLGEAQSLCTQTLLTSIASIASLFAL